MNTGRLEYRGQNGDRYYDRFNDTHFGFFICPDYPDYNGCPIENVYGVGFYWGMV